MDSNGAILSDSVLLCAKTLPARPDDVILDGRYVQLVPLQMEHDLEALHAVSNGNPINLNGKALEAYDSEELIWRYMSAGPFANTGQLASFLIPQVEAENGLCFCVLDKHSKQQVGVCNYMNNFPAHLKLELGNIWYSPIVQRTNTNLEATYLLLKHAFNLGYRRVEWKCDSLNHRSRRAALRMGFQFEGIQEQHFIIKGRNRDTAWYRILDHEWPAIQMSLEVMLDPD